MQPHEFRPSDSHRAPRGSNAPIERLERLIPDAPCGCGRARGPRGGKCRLCRAEARAALTRKTAMCALRARRSASLASADGVTVAPHSSGATRPFLAMLAEQLPRAEERHWYEARLRKLGGRAFTPERFLKGTRQPCWTPTFRAAVERLLPADPRLQRVPGKGRRRYARRPGLPKELDLALYFCERGVTA